jgi:hypothetical protein
MTLLFSWSRKDVCGEKSQQEFLSGGSWNCGRPGSCPQVTHGSDQEAELHLGQELDIPLRSSSMQLVASIARRASASGAPRPERHSGATVLGMGFTAKQAFPSLIRRALHAMLELV